MPAGDPVVTGELKALQDDVATSQRKRRSRQEAPAAATTDGPAREGVSANPHDVAEDAGDVQKLREQLRELVAEATEVFQDAEKGIATHPTASVLGALLLGILIGRHLGRH
jgi:hypothetical protein